jgi:hypothetical protein
MRTTGVVEGEVALDTGPGRGHRVVGVQVDFLILEGAPEPLDEDVVPPAPETIHADLDAVIEEQTRERGTGELRALVGVEDLRSAVARDGLLDGAMQKALSSVMESRQLKTRRVAQSITTARYTKPRAIGM